MHSPEQLLEGDGVERLSRGGDLSEQGRARLARRCAEALSLEILVAVEGLLEILLRVLDGVVGVGTQTKPSLLLLPSRGGDKIVLPRNVPAVRTDAPRDGTEALCEANGERCIKKEDLGEIFRTRVPRAWGPSGSRQ